MMAVTGFTVHPDDDSIKTTYLRHDVRIPRDLRRISRYISQIRVEALLGQIGSAEDGETALELIRRTRPDLILLDLLIPKLSGIEVARELLTCVPAPRILALSAETDAKTLYDVSQLGLPGFIDKKDSSIDVLKEAIQMVGTGKRYISPTVRERVASLRRDRNAFQKILSDREQEILSLIGGGHSDEQIASELGITESSAQTHRANILRKLELHSTAELMRYALEKGFWKSAYWD
jgi:two-component system NarL family response regulator